MKLSPATPASGRRVTRPGTGSAAAYDGFIVEAVEPERALVIGGDAGSLYRVIWASVLEPLDESRTRLLTRASGDYECAWVGLYLRLVRHPMHFAMERRQLLNLRRRSEATAP